MPIASGGDDDRLFGVVVLQDDEHAGVAVCLVDVLVEQLHRAPDIDGVEAGEVGRCAGGG
ncbi:hypothetical protein [Ralstonia psammae]|uniref:hypothetical protein n=1 Tax=Ralstonia psammae TaxID=3058598 RepID=UPI00293027B7|nr:hypothetical protein [Ralstonia sp. LMG 19083]